MAFMLIGLLFCFNQVLVRSLKGIFGLGVNYLDLVEDYWEYGIPLGVCVWPSY